MNHITLEIHTWQLQTRVLEVLKPQIEALDKKSIPHRLLWLHGEARDAVVDVCETERVDLLVIGTRGLGAVSRALVGSVSDYAVQHCHCPVAIVREAIVLVQDPGHRRLVGIALEPDTASYIEDWILATGLIKQTDKIFLLHASPRVGTRRILNLETPEHPPEHEAQDHRFLLSTAQQLRTRATGLSLDITPVLLHGSASEALQNAADDFSLEILVTGSKGKGAVKRLIMGSVSSSLVHHCHCPVIVVRKPQ